MARNGALWMLVVSLVVPLLNGCAPVVVTGAAVGVSVVHDRRTPGTVLDDEHIELQGWGLLNDHPDIREHSRIAVTSYNLVVLLTGQAETQEIRDRFAELVSRLPKVKRVVNEVTIGPSESLANEGEDALITSRVKLALVGIKLPHFDLTRIKVVTEAGVVYLMGLVTPAEAEATVAKARYVPGVKRVVKVFEYIQPPPSTPA
ncbi:MAG: BON domain-containing protein [Chromatiaceae bacterium]|jgi:osmotically-inducible protein OsmY